MEWVKARPQVGCDLCRSGVEYFPIKDLDFELKDVEITGYNVYGYPPLLRKISEKYGVNESEIVATLGTSHAIFLVCAAILERGDKVRYPGKRTRKYTKSPADMLNRKTQNVKRKT